MADVESRPGPRTSVQSFVATQPRSVLEQWCRSEARSIYLGEHKALCRILGTYNMLVDTRDMSLAPHLMLDGFWETWITQAVARHIRPGMLCADVGANWGYYTVLLSKFTGEGGHVTAWEPATSVAPLLRSTLALNGCNNVTVVQAAATDVKGESFLHAPIIQNGIGVLFGSSHLTGEDKGIRVKTQPLDDYAGDADFDFVKIDAEGAELLVWRGMKRSLKNPRIVVLMEFAPHGREADALELLADIERQGFPLCRVDTAGRIEPVTKEQAMKEPWQMLWLERGR